MATKYPTYTFPYLPPLAMGAGRQPGHPPGRILGQTAGRRAGPGLPGPVPTPWPCLCVASPLPGMWPSSSRYTVSLLCQSMSTAAVTPFPFTWYSGIPCSPPGDPGTAGGNAAGWDQLERQEHDAVPDHRGSAPGGAICWSWWMEAARGNSSGPCRASGTKWGEGGRWAVWARKT